MHQSAWWHAKVSAHTGTLNSQLFMGGLTRFSGLTVIQAKKHHSQEQWEHDLGSSMGGRCMSGPELTPDKPCYCLPHCISQKLQVPTRSEQVGVSKHQLRTLHNIKLTPVEIRVPRNNSPETRVTSPQPGLHWCGPSQVKQTWFSLCGIIAASLHQHIASTEAWSYRPGNEETLTPTDFIKIVHTFIKLKKHNVAFCVTKSSSLF